MESRAGIAPAFWWPCASTFAGHRLNGSSQRDGKFKPAIRWSLFTPVHLQGLKARQMIAQGKRDEVRAALGNRPNIFQALKGRKNFSTQRLRQIHALQSPPHTSAKSVSNRSTPMGLAFWKWIWRKPTSLSMTGNTGARQSHKQSKKILRFVRNPFRYCSFRTKANSAFSTVNLFRPFRARNSY